MNQYLVIAIVVILFWLVGFGIYFVTSNKQRRLEGEINQLSELLEDDGIG